MAKHIYHLPLQEVLSFSKENRSVLNEVFTDEYIFEYRKNFGKSYYDLEVESFIEFFKINKEYNYAVKNIKYFTSEKFFEEIYKLLRFEQYELKNITKRNFFYTFVFIISKNNESLCKKFFHKLFLHYHTSINSNSNIIIDYIDLSKTMAKNRGIELKESFGENEENKSYFKIFCDGLIAVELHGNSIKTLRKKAYKKLCFTLLDSD